MATQADFDRIGNYAVMYNKDKNIDRHDCKRIVPMEVLALGFSRTGTLSMQKAFSILGYQNPYHFSSFMDNIKDCDMWMEAIDAKYHGKGTFGKEQFDQLLGHVQAVTDMPCNLFGEELVKYYPESKVVLVERDIDSWYKSWCFFLEGVYSFGCTLGSFIDPQFTRRVSQVGFAGIVLQMGGATTLRESKAVAKDMYRQHYAEVRRFTPNHRLLEYKLGSGWEPLCEFLGRPIPDVPFPHLNDSVANQRSIQELAMKGMGNAVRRGAVYATLIAVLVLAMIWYRRL